MTLVPTVHTFVQVKTTKNCTVFEPVSPTTPFYTSNGNDEMVVALSTTHTAQPGWSGTMRTRHV